MLFRSNVVASPEQKIIAVKIEEAKLRRDTLKKHLVQVESELKRKSDQISIYSRLADVSQQLEELHKLGAGKIFWGDKYTNEEDLLDHLKSLRSNAKIFTDKIDIIREKRNGLEKQIEKAAYEVGYLIEELELAKQDEADSKNDFVIKRDYEPQPYRSMVMPWHNKGEDEKRFKKYLLLAFLYSVLFMLVIPYINLPIPDKDEIGRASCRERV